MIRNATIEDLPRFAKLAKDFMGATRFVRVDNDIFIRSWTTFITSGLGEIFILDDFHGALGAIIYQDPNNGEITATEMGWIVSPEHRGKGILLLNHYEQWAKEKGCKKVIMVHMADSMPEKLKILYRRRGYSEMETHYIKEM